MEVEGTSEGIGEAASTAKTLSDPLGVAHSNFISTNIRRPEWWVQMCLTHTSLDKTLCLQ